MPRSKGVRACVNLSETGYGLSGAAGSAVRELRDLLREVGRGLEEGPGAALARAWPGMAGARCPANRPGRSLWPRRRQSAPPPGHMTPDQRPGTQARVRPTPQPQQWGREGGRAAGPRPRRLQVPSRLRQNCKQKDSDYLSGAGASSSAVRLPGAGRVFSSRKAGGARALAPERRPRRLRRERQPLGKERAGLSHKRHVCGAKWEGGLEEPLYMAIGSRIEKEFFFKVAKTGKLAPRGREMSFFYNLHTFYKYFSVFKKTFED